MDVNCSLFVNFGSGKKSKISIFDIQGRNVYSTIFDSKLTIYPSEIKLNTGFYVIRVENGQKVSEQKQVVN